MKKQRKPKIGDLVAVTWYDHYGNHDWISEDELSNRLAKVDNPRGLIIKSVGYLFKIDKERVVVFANYGEKMVFGYLVILLRVVKDIKILPDPWKK